MSAKDYSASIRVKCGQAAYRAMVGASASNLLPWDRLGVAAKERYIDAAIAVLDEVKTTSAPAPGK